ncbi:CRISPR-associated helicase Cas3' [Streptomyces sp. N2A]|uniref:CRISPR-associated helicase Cas3' n=1 Tax=Streptomyces sp. N2A TaxID=3073936 RepID=UPI0028708DD6|nr:CRISPR-associated helicase Cas3' [Streptomyces sp. N2A]
MQRTREDGQQAWLWVVGKTDLRRVSRNRGGPLWNPLFAHMLDAAACAECLWDHYLPPFTRARLAEAFGGDEHLAKKVVMVLAALHDLGKASPCFLRMVGDSYLSQDPELEQAGQQWRQQARAAGLPLPDDAEMAGAPWARHEHVTAEVLPRILGCECRRRCGGTGRYDSSARGLHAAADLLGGHHGHIPSSATVHSAFPATAAETVGDGWEPVHQDLVNAVLEILGIGRREFAAALRPERPSAIPLALGLIVVSDWLASDENRFPYRRLGTACSGWWKASRNQARQAVDDLRLKAWPVAPGRWADLYPDTPTPRPFQAAGLAALPKAGPVMMLVESDTGSGKTKLALAAAHHVAQVTGAGGVYQAMPTRASVGQVTGVLEKFLRSALPPGVAAPLAVVHGTAKADSRVHALLDAGEQEKAAAEDDLFDLAPFMGPTMNGDHSPAGGSAVLDEWYLRRWLGLVSPFAVGTVDQIVLGSQRSKHWAVRLFGLCTKTVIIDEAHAYELYQQRLLDAAVAWLADAGTSVVVLSATLPAKIRASLTQAWCQGHRVEAADDGTQGPITVIDAEGTVTRTGPSEAVPSLWTAIDLQPDPGAEALAEQIASQVEHGGILAVLRTRVDPCVDLYELVREKAIARGWGPDVVMLFHSRFMPRDRQPLEQTIEQKLGPNPDDKSKPNPKRPKRLIVIATQVIEQSLDIDFDLLITDLAPTDLLIQRRGRIHRHSTNHDQRPDWCWHEHLLPDGTRLRMPKMQVLWKPSADGLPIVEPPEKGERKPSNLDGLVYNPYPLLASWRVIKRKQGPDGLTVISTPGDSPELIEAVYGERQTAGGEEGKLVDRTWATWQADLDDEDQEASTRVIAPYSNDGTPVRMSELASGEDIGDGEAGSGMRGLKALSRLGEPTVNAITFYQQADGTLTYDPEGMQKADLRYRSAPKTKQEKKLYREQQTNLLLNTLPIPAHWFSGKKALPKPETWPILDHPPVRRSHVALLSPNGECIRGPVGIRYTPLTGLERT